MSSRLAHCYLSRNSSPLVGGSGALTEHREMGIRQQKEWRRHQLACLMDEIGQTKLAGMTGIPAAYLFQMSKGTGKNKRGVSDENAALIEARTNRPGWFSFDDGSIPDLSEPPPGGKLTPAQLRLSALVHEHLWKLQDEQAQAIITLIESWARSSQSQPANKRMERT